MQNETLIEAKSLSKRYGPTTNVGPLDLELRAGEILGLLGPNGAGKSTTMKMLTGNLAPTAGEVRIKGVSLREEPKAAKRFLGYLPEQPPVYPELTVDEYLDYVAGLHGIARKERSAAVTSAKKDCGLSGVASRLIGNLSKGYQQRVGLAQAIIHRPDVIVLDEPTVGLDPIQIREIRDLIRALGQRHSVILSSHILPEVQSVCSRVMIINRGRRVFNEPMSAIGQSASIIASFARAPDQSALAGIAGVAAAIHLGEGRWQFTTKDGADPREGIVEAAVSGRWGLTELRTQVRSLEEIFVELTSGEDLKAAA